MSIERGVSLYSYQQAYYKGELDLKGCIHAAAKIAGARGIELIPEQMPVGVNYPEVMDADVDRWFGWMDEFQTVPTCMDAFVDTMLYKNRQLTAKEQVQMVARDLALASRLGFSCIRMLCFVRPEIFEMALPYAEHYNVKMGLEIHQPLKVDSPYIEQYVNLADKLNTKYIGLIPDFGIFNRRPPVGKVEVEVLRGADRQRLEQMCQEYAKDGDIARVMDAGRAIGATPEELKFMQIQSMMLYYNAPETLRAYKDYILHFHGKFYDMTPDCTEPNINYEGAIQLLKEMDWSGYISSEYEGQRAWHAQDIMVEMDEVEQVRRHHVMLKQLIGH